MHLPCEGEEHCGYGMRRPRVAGGTLRSPHGFRYTFFHPVAKGTDGSVVKKVLPLEINSLATIAEFELNHASGAWCCCSLTTLLCTIVEATLTSTFAPSRLHGKAVSQVLTLRRAIGTANTLITTLFVNWLALQLYALAQIARADIL